MSKGGPKGPYETNEAVSDAQAADRPREAPTRSLPRLDVQQNSSPDLYVDPTNRRNTK